MSFNMGYAAQDELEDELELELEQKQEEEEEEEMFQPWGQAYVQRKQEWAQAQAQAEARARADEEEEEAKTLTQIRAREEARLREERVQAQALALALAEVQALIDANEEEKAQARAKAEDEEKEALAKAWDQVLKLEEEKRKKETENALAQAEADEEEEEEEAQTQQPPPCPPSHAAPGMESSLPHPFFWHRGTFVPNADVQIVRWDRSRPAVLFRLSDFLYNSGVHNPTSQIFDWDWIDLSKLAFQSLVSQLAANGYLLDGEELWWSPRPLGSWTIDRLREPSTDETVITSSNANLTIERGIASHHIFLPFLDQVPVGPRLQERPFFNIVIRPYDPARGLPPYDLTARAYARAFSTPAARPPVSQSSGGLFGSSVPFSRASTSAAQPAVGNFGSSVPFLPFSQASKSVSQPSGGLFGSSVPPSPPPVPSYSSSSVGSASHIARDGSGEYLRKAKPAQQVESANGAGPSISPSEARGVSSPRRSRRIIAPRTNKSPREKTNRVKKSTKKKQKKRTKKD